MSVGIVNQMSPDPFINELNDWVEASPPNEKEGRQRAAASLSARPLFEGLEGVVSLGSCGVTVFPPLPRLTQIILSVSNPLLKAPDLSGYERLRAIYLPSCGLSTLPQLPGLMETIFLSGNPFSGVLDFSRFPNLSVVDLSRCGLAIFPRFIPNANISVVNLEGNPLQVFPADDQLPRVAYYFGIRPASEEGRRRLQIRSASVLPKKPEGRFISPTPFFQGRRPMIGVGTHGTAFIMGSKLPEFIQHMGGSPLPVNLHGPEKLNQEELSIQVQSSITQLRSLGERNIPITLFRNVDPNSPIGKIEAYAKEQIAKVEALVLPGGMNVEEEFYNPNAPVHLGRDSVRTIVEFALVKEALAAKKPVYGICRGAQLLNVYLGGTLRDGGEDGWNAAEVAKSSRQTEIESLLDGNSMTAFSMHQQCCDEIASDLEVVLKSDDIPKFLVSKNPDVPVVASQVHLEETHEGEYSVGFRLVKFFTEKVPKQMIQAKL